MDYEPFKDLPGVKYMFQTERPFATEADKGRGSTYAFFDDNSTMRNRSGERHADTSTGLQPRSYKTIFLDPSAQRQVADVFHRTDVATRMVPVLDEKGNPTGKLRVVLEKDYTYRPVQVIGGKFIKGEPVTAKAGSVMAEVPYSNTPQKGFHPLEVLKDGMRSSVGEKGNPGAHFGSKITEVLEKLDKKMQQGKAAVEKGAARGGGAYGGAMPSLENTTFQQYMKMNRGGFVEKQDPKAGNWKFI